MIWRYLLGSKLVDCSSKEKSHAYIRCNLPSRILHSYTVLPTIPTNSRAQTSSYKIRGFSKYTHVFSRQPLFPPYMHRGLYIPFSGWLRCSVENSCVSGGGPLKSHHCLKKGLTAREVTLTASPCGLMTWSPTLPGQLHHLTVTEWSSPGKKHNHKTTTTVMLWG